MIIYTSSATRQTARIVRKAIVGESEYSERGSRLPKKDRSEPHFYNIVAQCRRDADRLAKMMKIRFVFRAPYITAVTSFQSCNCVSFRRAAG